MGYALFTARKLSLNTRVNNLNARLASISNQRDALTNKISMKELQKKVDMNKEMSKYRKDLATAQEQGTDTSLIMANMNIASSKYTMTDAEIAELEDQDSCLDTLQKTIETQLKAAQQELESVEKAEESAIKSATPKYTA